MSVSIGFFHSTKEQLWTSQELNIVCKIVCPGSSKIYWGDSDIFFRVLVK